MLTSCNVEYIQDILSTLNNQFRKDVLKSFLNINYKTEIGEEQILKSPLFYNRNIKIDRKYVFYKPWYDKGIRFVNDLVNQNGSFYSYQEVRIDGNPLNILKYQGFVDSLKVSNGAKIRNRYNQVPHLTQDTNGKVTNSQKTPQTRAKRSALSQQVTTKHI